MPIVSRKSGEDKRNFMSRCMSDPKMKKEYPDQRQRGAVCDSKASLISWADDEFKKDVENDIEEEATAIYVYKNPRTGELFFFERQGIYRKDGTVLVLVTAEELNDGRENTGLG